MELKALDHLVLTTQNLDACLHFYVDILGMRHIEQNGRHALAFGYQKINIHTQKGEFSRLPPFPLTEALIYVFSPKRRSRRSGTSCWKRAGPFWRALWSVPARWEKWTASISVTRTVTL